MLPLAQQPRHDQYGEDGHDTQNSDEKEPAGAGEPRAGPANGVLTIAHEGTVGQTTGVWGVLGVRERRWGWGTPGDSVFPVAPPGALHLVVGWGGVGWGGMGLLVVGGGGWWRVTQSRAFP
ncbi:hypothetical protein GCM10010211_54620 [Streptomyces albospinus]|uniref:Uncharacterized protein n=1 Tax=Streptomyces albospinus TaxID=285515 RepID=A0ABQ2VGT6_9ACTN|nr:hypothetical protein GCM10010211_54620 [Streptomyces albospinus]